MGVKELQ